MALDFSAYPMVDDAFNGAPFHFVPEQAGKLMSLLNEIDLIESGSRVAREIWQNKQLNNILQHARQRSAFWRGRVPDGELQGLTLSQLPILTRLELVKQIAEEGALLSEKDGYAVMLGKMTSGSSGTPVQIFVTPQNANYNGIRSVYEYFKRGWPIDENRTRLDTPKLRHIEQGADNLTITTDQFWIGNLALIFKNGINKTITLSEVNDAVLNELRKDRIGYLSCGSWYLRNLLNATSPEELKKLGMIAWVQAGGSRVEDLYSLLQDAGIKTTSNYSCAEIGPIGQECPKYPGFYHVTNSNVIVDEDNSVTAEISGKTLSRVLVTHLHGYATPVVRYDVGDFAVFHQNCPCGHDGTALSEIYGRRKNFVHHRDGRFTEFAIFAKAGRHICDFKQWRFQQLSYDEIKLELSGISSLSQDQIEQFTLLVQRVTGPEFKLLIETVDEIDWTNNPKELFFVSHVAPPE